MRGPCPQMPSHEDLPPAAQLGRGGEIAAIDHAARGDVLTAGQRDAAGSQFCRACLRADGGCGQFAAQRSIEIPAGERTIGRRQVARMARKGDIVTAGPLGRGKASHELRPGSVEIAGEPAPAVVAAQAVARFEDRYVQLGMGAAHCQRGQSARQAAADHGHIDHAPVHRPWA